ncbi:MAG: GIY-YIG nuclease family protein [Bacteroidetes bacterium]|nr:GIY-YIG nuclease family protein [Bacteroidota bacterium]
MKTIILPFCVYVLISDYDHLLYIGYTRNLTRRLNSHFSGKVKSTKGRLPLRLIYSEFHFSKADARRREMYFKTSAGRKAIKTMLRESLKLHNYGILR